MFLKVLTAALSLLPDLFAQKESGTAQRHRRRPIRPEDDATLSDLSFEHLTLVNHQRSANEDRGPLASADSAAALDSVVDLRVEQEAIFALPGYEILGELGRGGMGVVYHARQLETGRVVALKMLHRDGPDDVQDVIRFQLEAATIARLDHPNIVRIYDQGEYQGRPFIALEFVDGSTLTDEIVGIPHAFAQAAGLVETLARAVHHAHQAGIVHRDLKPSNVLLSRDGTPKIVDFGLAQPVDDQPPIGSRLIEGTPRYMAPEQTTNQGGRIGIEADIYSLGSILYHLLTGRPPFQASDMRELLEKVRCEEPLPPRELKASIPADLEAICLVCLQKDPARRYSSALALAEDLQRFLANQPVEASRMNASESTSSCPQNHLSRLAGCLINVPALLFSTAIPLA